MQLSVKEVSKLITGRFFKTFDDVWKLDDTKEAIHNTMEPDECPDEEAYITEQIIAGDALTLKNYYLNPGKDTLSALKSFIGFGVDSEYSPIAIAFLKQKIGDSKKELLEKLILQERILETPDNIWEQALKENSEDFGIIKQAPELETPPPECSMDELMEDFKDLGEKVDKYGLDGIIKNKIPTFPNMQKREEEANKVKYACTYKITGNTDALLAELKRLQDELIEEQVEGIIKYSLAFFHTTSTLGQFLKNKEYLEKNGLDGFIDYDYLHFYKFKKENNETLLHFYYCTKKPDTFYLVNYYWEGLLDHLNLKFTREDYNLSSFETTRQLSDIKQKLSKL